MKAEDIVTIEDLIAFLGEEKTEQLFLDYLIEIIGQKNQDEKPLFEY